VIRTEILIRGSDRGSSGGLNNSVRGSGWIKINLKAVVPRLSEVGEGWSAREVFPVGHVDTASIL
jgi:hypothetical protein